MPVNMALCDKALKQLQYFFIHFLLPLSRVLPTLFCFGKTRKALRIPQPPLEEFPLFPNTVWHFRTVKLRLQSFQRFSMKSKIGLLITFMIWVYLYDLQCNWFISQWFPGKHFATTYEILDGTLLLWSPPLRSIKAWNFIFERTRPFLFTKGQSIEKSYSPWETFEGAPRPRRIS